MTDVKATVIRSPYLRDAVYRWQHTRGFGRLTMTALHLDEEWFCRAAWRQIARAGPTRPTSCTRTRSTRRPGSGAATFPW